MKSEPYVAVSGPEAVMASYCSQVIDVLLSRCNRMGLVCKVSLDIQQPDGKRVVHLDAHGTVEMDK